MGSDALRAVALVTAKGGNESLPGKNLIPIAGLPSLVHAIWAARTAGLFQEVFISTEDREIAEVGQRFGASVLWRPGHLARPDSNHGDVIIHAASEIQSRAEAPEVLTVLLGNTVMVEPEDIRATIDALREDPSLDSAMTVWVAQDDHPLRAMRVDEEGLLHSYLDVPTPDTNRQSYPEAVFYDQGPWTVRFESLLASSEHRGGPGPWWWMGPRCRAIRRPWITGRDTHTDLDLAVAEWWVERSGRDRRLG